MIDDGQRKAAKVVGVTYLLALPAAMFAEFFVRARLIVPDSAVQTALNIAAHPRLFRLGIASNLAVVALDVALITGLYLVLKPVSRGLALLALGWGLVETAILGVVSLSDLDVLRILSGADWLRAIEPGQLQVLARLSAGTHGAGYNIALALAGLRSTAFCYLWLKSGYVPKALAGLGILASAVMGLCTFSFVVFPELVTVIPAAAFGGPIFLFELSMGLWLVVKELRQPRAA